MLGLFIGLTMIIVSIMMNGSIKGYIDFPSLVITIGGSLMALFIAEPFENIKKLPTLLKITFSEKITNKGELIDLFIDLSKKAKKEGFNAIEEQVEELEDKFLKRGLLMVIDAMDVEFIKDILDLEIEAAEERHGEGQRLFKKWGEYAPAFGMLGTIIGLIGMLANLSDAQAIGTGMATALITTFYGALFANLIVLPIAGNLEMKSTEESLNRAMMIDGILAVQNKMNAMNIEEKLSTYLSPQERLKRKDDSITKVELENA
jgi:chemotaxis protein MotA